MKVLEGFGPDGPKLRAPRVKATLRHLATHTSGLAYEFWNPDMPKYLEVAQHPTILAGLKVSLNYPLMFDPGERWSYGIGIDWLGQMVEMVDVRRIDQFCKEEIFGPLKMNDTAFEVEDHIPGIRRAGSRVWAGVLMTQSLPFIEPRYASTYEAFERAAYKAL